MLLSKLSGEEFPDQNERIMKVGYQLSAEQLQGILDFLADDGETKRLDIEAASTFLAISAAVGRAIVKENGALVRKNALLERKLERMLARQQSEKQSVIENEWFGSTGLRCPEVAYPFLYKLQEHNFYLTRDKFWFLMYMMYSSYLFHFESTICLEHPCAIAQGPRFWSIKDMSLITPVDRKWWLSLTEKSPALAKFIENYAIKHGNMSEADCEKYVMRSEPFRNAMESAKCAGLKSGKISDKDIYLWKQSELP